MTLVALADLDLLCSCTDLVCVDSDLINSCLILF
jgi:hypothetical protein